MLVMPIAPGSAPKGAVVLRYCMYLDSTEEAEGGCISSETSDWIGVDEGAN